MNQDLSILQLVLGASWVVQAVMLLLVGVSISSWAAIGLAITMAPSGVAWTSPTGAM